MGDIKELRRGELLIYKKHRMDSHLRILRSEDR